MTLNPFESTGGVFLAFYACTIGCALAGLAALRRLAVTNAIDPDRPLPTLDAFEAAVLAGGSDRLALVTIASLVDRGYASFHGDRLQYGGKMTDSTLHPAERAILSLEPSTVARAKSRLAPHAAAIEASLAAEALLPGRDASQPYVLATVATGLLIVAMGVTKVIVGLQRGRPVEFLLILIVVAIVAFASMFGRRLPPTKRGELVLSRLHLARPRFGERPRAAPNDGGMLIALSGLSAMSMRDDYRHFKRSMASGGGDASVDASGGSSCGSGGGDGGGGSSCGGGGCGGCGGGD